ncbi:MAG: HupE/UreJ family protein [Woeseiaceae bacterium]|nr:HupE/UreJ family protein [Woeseiaceae bacterium]
MNHDDKIPAIDPVSHIARRLSKIAAVVALTFVCSAPVAAHEIPTDVVIQTILKPHQQTLDFLVRVPLEAMRDVNFPQSGPGYLVISQADETIRDAAVIWIGREVRLFENGRHLDQWEVVAARLSLPSDRSFDSYAQALESFEQPPLPDDTELFRNQALLDVLLRYPITSDTSEFSIDPQFARLGLRTTTVVHFLPSDGVERVFEFSGDPGLVRLDPRWHHAFFRFVGSGIEHILDGVDHLLFVICLLIPFRRIRPLVVIVTSFTVAHSITLFASAFGLVPEALWFPPLIETLIAASIVYMAFENIVGSRWQRRWMIAFGFGLVHGFGFSFALSETLQFAGRHLLTSLFAFNIGVEIGQLIVIAIAVPVMNWLMRNAFSERMGTIILSAILAHSGWHWMSSRAADLAAYSFQKPALDYALLASLMRWAMLTLIIGSTVWVLYHVYRRYLKADQADLSQSGSSS